MVSVGIIGGHEAAQTHSIMEGLRISPERVIETASGKPKKFDVLVVIGTLDIPCIRKHIELLTEKEILLINADDKSIYPLLQNSKAGFITYGFNSKACITASSVGDNGSNTVQVCVQRSFKNFYKKTIVQQEFAIYLGEKTYNIYSVLAAVSAGLYIYEG